MNFSLELYKMRLMRVVEEAPLVNTFYFEKPEGYSWQEGEHIHLAFPDFRDGEKPNRARVRHMSIASLASENEIMITTRMNEESPFKQSLIDLGLQGEMALFNPSCKLKLRRQDKDLVLLTMGVGMAAFRPLILAHANDPSGIRSLTSISISKPGQEVYRQELQPYESSDSRQIWATNRQSFYQTVAEMPLDAIYYVVGSDEFIQTNLHNLLTRGIRDENIVLDLRDDLRDFYIDRAKKALLTE